eukprot:m.68833 g.68833  ORF g.68833 m.68833 type:complete len:265 (-) comp16009_c0_seq15:2192-2986(-)
MGDKPGVTMSRKCMFLTKMLLYFSGFLACTVALGSFLRYQSKLQKDISTYQKSVSDLTPPIHHCVINFAHWLESSAGDDDVGQGDDDMEVCQLLYNGTQSSKDIDVCYVTLASAASGSGWGLGLLATTVVFFRKKLLRIKSCHVIEKIVAISLTILLIAGASSTTDGMRKFCGACSASGSCADCSDLAFKTLGRVCSGGKEQDFLQGYINAMQLVEFGLRIGAGAYLLLAVLLLLTRGGLIKQEDPSDAPASPARDDDDVLLVP